MTETSCDKRGHVMSPTSPRCCVCGVYSSQMMLVTREAYEQTRQRLVAAEARIQTLREAIKPFAEFAKRLDEFDDEHSVIRRKDWLVSDHRKAAAAYGDD